MKRILIVEPEDEFRELLSVKLIAEDFDVVVAKDGQRALEIVTTEKIDLVLMEPELEGITGFDLIDLLETTPHLEPIKIIVLARSLSKATREKITSNYHIEQYWFKNQVGIANVVNEIHKLLDAGE